MLSRREIYQFLMKAASGRILQDFSSQQSRETVSISCLGMTWSECRVALQHWHVFSLGQMPPGPVAVRTPPYQIMYGIYTWTHYRGASVGMQSPLQVIPKEGPWWLSVKGILIKGFNQCQLCYVERKQHLHTTRNKLLCIIICVFCSTIISWEVSCGVYFFCCSLPWAFNTDRWD